MGPYSTHKWDGSNQDDDDDDHDTSSGCATNNNHDNDSSMDTSYLSPQEAAILGWIMKVYIYIKLSLLVIVPICDDLIGCLQ
jgi:hypothetical protein